MEIKEILSRLDNLEFKINRILELIEVKQITLERNNMSEQSEIIEKLDEIKKLLSYLVEKDIMERLDSIEKLLSYLVEKDIEEK